MNKTMQRLGLTAVVAGLLAGGAPAEAASSHTLAIGSAPGLSAGRTAFFNTGCQMSAGVSALNGTDTRIVDVSNRPNQTVRISWTAANPSEGWLAPSLWSAGCGTIVVSNPQQLRDRAGTSFFIPAGAKWLVMEGVAVANVTFTIAP